MRVARYYKVAGHRFCVSGEAEALALMTNYEPFGCEGGEVLFELNIEGGDRPEYTEELRQEDEGLRERLRVGESKDSGMRLRVGASAGMDDPKSGVEQEIICGHTALDEPVFEFVWWQQTAGWLVCSADYRQGRLITTDKHTKMAIDNALMVMYALATAGEGTALFHAAVVSHLGKAYMFLGKSGTGKSTHARLWLQYIEGTELVNDDNPVVRDGVVYGSPWSGKTPCYRNVSYPVGGIVVLSQAPYNKIQRLKGIPAYVALVESISGKRWDERIADGLHQTENALAMNVPMWHLECLPDEEAARVCSLNIEDKKLKVMVTDEVMLKEAIRLVGEGVSVTLPVDGRSMLPFIIGGRESVILQKPTKPKLGDVVLAWVDGCRYVVHRIIRIDGKRVTLMGDGNLAGTEHCALSDIKAIATHVVSADGKQHDLNGRWRKRAARLWWYLRPIRRYLLAIYRRIEKLKL